MKPIAGRLRPNAPGGDDGDRPAIGSRGHSRFPTPGGGVRSVGARLPGRVAERDRARDGGVARALAETPRRGEFGDPRLTGQRTKGLRPRLNAWTA